jgi:O-antigen/teichoic acid export membrane protein
MSTRFRTDVMWSALASMTPLVLAALAIPLLLRTLPAADFALFAMGAAIVSLAPALDFGISRATFRRISKFPNDFARARSLAQYATRLMLKVSIGLTLLGAIPLLTYLSVRPGSNALLDSGSPTLLVALLGLSPALLSNIQRTTLEATGNFRSSATVRLALGALLAIAPVVTSFWCTAPAALIGSTVAVRWITYFYQRYLLERVLPAVDAQAAPDAALQGMWKDSALFGIVTPCSLFMNGFDKFIPVLAGVISLQQLSAFVAPQEFALKLMVIPAALIPALSMRLADQRRSSSSNANLLRLVFSLTAGAALLACLVAAWTANNYRSRLYGNVSDNMLPWTHLLALVAVFSNVVAQFPAAKINSTGSLEAMAKLQIGELVLFIPAMVHLTAGYGAVGAAAAWSIRTVLDTVLLFCIQPKDAVGSVRAQVFHLAGIACIVSAALRFS